MNYSLYNKYRERFEAVKKIERAENRKLSMQARFQQLSSLFSMGISLGLSFREKKGKSSPKSNWLLMKA